MTLIPVYPAIPSTKRFSGQSTIRKRIHQQILQSQRDTLTAQPEQRREATRKTMLSYMGVELKGEDLLHLVAAQSNRLGLLKNRVLLNNVLPRHLGYEYPLKNLQSAFIELQKVGLVNYHCEFAGIEHVPYYWVNLTSNGQKLATKEHGHATQARIKASLRKQQEELRPELLKKAFFEFMGVPITGLNILQLIADKEPGFLGFKKDVNVAQLLPGTNTFQDSKIGLFQALNALQKNGLLQFYNGTFNINADSVYYVKLTKAGRKISQQNDFSPM